tara:strand:- start:2633 stop:4234 length:1602 start_codon:yes stop_codon:yes gene_type:complete
MPGLKVFIKGLNKTVDFPVDTPMEVIEQSIKGGWNDIERISGLPMDTASRMDRARFLGFDPDNVIYSGTGGNAATEILPYGVTKASDGTSQSNLFGGIFGSFDDEVAGSHGDTIQELLTKKHVDHEAMRHDVFFDDSSSEVADKHFRDIIGGHKQDVELSNDEIDELLDFTMGEKHIEQIEPDMGFERFNEIMGTRLSEGNGERLSDAGWDFQGLKGELGRRMGYDSIGMPDEHGESVLVLSGRLKGATFDPTKKASGNLLASAAGATVGLGALAQSDESEAGVLGKGAKKAFMNTPPDDFFSDLVNKHVSGVKNEHGITEHLDSFGVRIMSENPTTGEKTFSKVGDSINNSFDFEDGLSTGKELDGVSTIGIDYDGFDVTDIEGSLNELTPYLKTGDEAVLVGGVGSREGNDIGESIISSPRVIHVFNRSKGAASAAGATVGLGALAQSDESGASQSASRLLQEGLAGQKSKAFNIPFPLLNKVGLTLQEFPQSLIAGGIGKGLETLSMGRENELTDEEIRSRAIDVGLDFL